jgi:hypothetical protein
LISIRNARRQERKNENGGRSMEDYEMCNGQFVSDIDSPSSIFAFSQFLPSCVPYSNCIFSAVNLLISH